jgi:hypothetical protein
MRGPLLLSTLILFLLPVTSAIYKAKVLGLSMLPQEISEEWNLEVKIDTAYFSKADKLTLPVPQDSQTQEITHISFNLPDSLKPVELHQTNLHFLRLEGDFSNIRSSIGYQFRARSKTLAAEFPDTARSSALPAAVKKYTTPGIGYSREDRDALDELSGAIIDQSATTISSVKKVFFYVSEEIRPGNKTLEIPEALALGLGSTYTKAKIFNYLIRTLGVPSRIGAGIQLEKDPALRPHKNLYRIIFFNELYINGSWHQIDLQKKTPGPLPELFIILTNDIEFLDLSLKKLQNLSVYAAPLRTNRYDSRIYSDELKRSDSLYYTFSLFSLPLSAQMSMYIILLLPLGAVMISFFRNIVGFSTFGIFTPALLTIFFIETQFTFAIIFFALVVFLGFFQRILLDRLYLLAVPRISILLTFVIIAYMLFILINQNITEISSAGSGILSYFPVVIITILIERFSIDFIEEGAWNTFKKLAGTIIIAFVCYFILTFKILQQFLFANPEFLLWTIALNLIIGNYKGYRISEFFRFRELSKNINV